MVFSVAPEEIALKLEESEQRIFGVNFNKRLYFFIFDMF